MEKGLDKVVNTRGVDIEGNLKKGKKGVVSPPRLIGDGADEAVGLFKAKDEIMLIGEIDVILLMLKVSCDGCCQQGVH